MGAAALASLGRHAEAQALLGAALEWCPANEGVLMARAQSFTGQAQWPQAEEAWGAMHRLRPGQSGPLIALVQVLGHQEKWEAAEAVLRDLCAGDDARFELRAAQADLAARRQDWPLALCRWQALRLRFPDHPSAWCGPIGVALRQGDLTLAEGLAAEAAARFPDQPAVLNLCGRVAVAAVDWAQAEQRWARLRAVEPMNAQAWLQQAIALRALGQGPQAAALLAEAATLFPDDAPIAKLRRHWQMRQRMG
jgi:predicted Zn-dependent protease